jgi:AraC-like DNA-binding protein
MTDFQNFDMMVRGGALALLALWSWQTIRDHWYALPARIAIVMNVTVACHVIATAQWANSYPHLGWLFEIGSASVPPAFWLFSRTWFNDEQRVGWKSCAMFPICSFLAVIIDTGIADHLGGPLPSQILLRLAMVAFSAAGLWAAWRGKDEDLVEDRRRLRAAMIWAVGTFVLLSLIAEVLVHNHLAAPIWLSVIELGIFILTFAFCGTLCGARLPDMFGPKEEAVAPAVEPMMDDPLGPRLLAFMEHQLPHRDERLTIAALAAQLGEQEYRLRRVINGALGYRNFAQFLNGYRLAEVKSALIDPSQKDVPILTIALDAGFGSLGPFNRAFREVEGMTPSAFRARAA